MKKYLFILTIICQLVLIIYLFKKNSAKNDLLGVSVNPIYESEINRELDDELSYFYEPKPNKTYEKENDWIDSKYEYSINEDSLNERFNYNSKKDPYIFRIITLGDSFTFGDYVNTKDNWTELLEDLLNSSKLIKCPDINKYEVINLGVGGYDTAYEVERFKRRGVKYNPDLLVVFIVDYMRMTDYRMANKKNYSSAEIIEFRKKGIYFPGKGEDKNLKDEVRISYQYPYYHRLLRLYSGPVLIIDHQKNPKAEIFFYPLIKKYPKLSYIKTNLPIKEPKTSFPDGHPNKDGHKAIAQDVFDYLMKSGLLPCK